MAGLVFFVSLLPSALAVLVVRGPRDRGAITAACGAMLLIIVSVGFGQLRLSAPVSPGATFGLAAIDDFIGPRTPQAQAERVWGRYEQHVEDLARQGAQVVVLPEKIAVLDPEDAAAVQRRFAAAAARSRVWLMIGIGTDDGRQRLNLAWLFSPSGSLSARYQKHHLAPPEREFVAGRGYDVHRIGANTIGLAICKDMHFAETGLQYARRGVDLALVPSWDFGEDGQYAARQSAMRGVESGFAMARTAREGLLTVTDPFGRIVAETSSAPMPGATLITRVPAAGATPTVYATSGDLFGWLCVALSVPIMLGVGMRRGPLA